MTTFTLVWPTPAGDEKVAALRSGRPRCRFGDKSISRFDAFLILLNWREARRLFGYRIVRTRP